MPVNKRTPYVKKAIDNPGPYVAKVISHVDPRHSGDLRVELQTNAFSGNDANEEGQIITARYLMPFYGVSDVSSNTRNDDYRSTQQSYGFWAVPPDPGTKVLVILAEGSLNQAYWIGCIQDEYMNFMVPGNPSTTLTSDSTPSDLKGKKLPTGEYNKKLNNTGPNPTSYKKPINIDSVNQLVSSGLVEDEIRGVTTTGARREVPSNVFGWSTPGPLDKRQGAPKGKYGPTSQAVDYYRSRLGGSAFAMDDGDHRLIRKGHPKDTPMQYVNKEAGETGGDQSLPFSDLVRLRTRTGHQILMHNSEDLIYIANGRGTAWIELTSNGKVDIYAADIVSVHSQQDLNFTADRDINLTAGQDLNVVANKIKQSSFDSTNIISGTTYSVNASKDITLNTSSDMITFSEGNTMMASQGQGSFISTGNMAIGSATTLGIESCASIKVSTDGTIDIKALGDIKQESDANVNIKAGTQARFSSGESFNIKGTGIVYVKSDASIDIQNIEPTAPDSATIPAAPYVTSPTPPEKALPTSRVPQHEPWFEHENMDPIKYGHANTRAGNQQGETYPPSTPDTFKRGPAGTVTESGSVPNSYNSSGAPEGSSSFDPTAAADIPPDPPATKIGKQELSRKFAAALTAQGFTEEQVYSAIACAETESALQLRTESSYAGTSNDRIRSIFSAARTVSDSQLTTIKADKTQFFELVYGNTSKIGPGMGNTTPGDGGKFIGRGLIQLTGKANYQRYGKLAGLTDEALVSDYNPFGVKIIDDPTLLLTDVEASVAVTAAYLKERYKDFGRGILGNFRFAIAGTEGGYNLGRPKDQGYYKAKFLANGKYDPDWIRDPNRTIGV